MDKSLARVIVGLGAIFWLGTMVGAEEPSLKPSEDRMELPGAPEGYVWEKCAPVKGAVLRPKDWFFEMEQSASKTTTTYFVTKERIEPGKNYETGVSVNVIHAITAKSHRKPSEYAKLLLGVLAKSTTQEAVSEGRLGTMPTLEATMVDKSGGEPLQMRYVLVPNDQTGTLHVAMFESPVRLWKES